MALAELHVTLPPDLADLVRGKVASGAFSSEDEVIREALKLLQEREAEAERQEAWLRQKVRGALHDPRPPVVADDVFDDLRRRHESKRKNRA